MESVTLYFLVARLRSMVTLFEYLYGQIFFVLLLYPISKNNASVFAYFFLKFVIIVVILR